MPAQTLQPTQTRTSTPTHIRKTWATRFSQMIQSLKYRTDSTWAVIADKYQTRKMPGKEPTGGRRLIRPWSVGHKITYS